MPGKHWLVIYIGEDGYVEYFDPLAEAPNSTTEHYLWRISPEGYLKITTVCKVVQVATVANFAYIIHISELETLVCSVL